MLCLILICKDRWSEPYSLPNKNVKKLLPVNFAFEGTALKYPEELQSRRVALSSKFRKILKGYVSLFFFNLFFSQIYLMIYLNNIIEFFLDRWSFLKILNIKTNFSHNFIHCGSSLCIKNVIIFKSTAIHLTNL